MATQKKSKVASERDEGARALWRWLSSRLDLRRGVFLRRSPGGTSRWIAGGLGLPGESEPTAECPRKQGQEPYADRLAELVCEGRVDVPREREGGDHGRESLRGLLVEHFLAPPSLSEGQVVVRDNLGAHRPERIRELIEDGGAELVFVPSYSPEHRTP
jgi:hypothetical protein